MKKKIMSLSCLMVAAALAGCSAAAPAAASEETTTPETSEMTEIPPEAAPRGDGNTCRGGRHRLVEGGTGLQL